MGLAFAQAMFKQKISVADLSAAARDSALKNGAAVAYDPAEPEIARRIIKETDRLELPRFLDGVATAAGVAWDPAEEKRLADRTLMTWDHVRALHAGGMGIGSHTCNHRVLHTLAPDALRVLSGGAAAADLGAAEPEDVARAS